MNLCDLSFFWSPQKRSLEQDGREDTLESMQKAVIQAFKDYPSERLKSQCVYMYSTFRALLANEGEIDYRLPHGGKRKGSENGAFLGPVKQQGIILRSKRAHQ